MTTLRSLILGVSLIAGFGGEDARAQVRADHFFASCRADVMTIDGLPRLVLFGGLGGFGAVDHMSWYPDRNATSPFPGVDIFVRRAFVHVTDPCQIGMALGLRGNQGSPDLYDLQPITQLGWNGDPVTLFNPIVPALPNPNSGLAPSGSDFIWDIVVDQPGPWYSLPPNPCNGGPPFAYVLVCDVALF